METDLRTPSEKVRDERNESVVRRFRTLSDEQPDAAPHRIFTVIASEFGMSVMGIKNIVSHAGLYQPKKS
jgi:hypothetical protein